MAEPLNIVPYNKKGQRTKSSLSFLPLVETVGIEPMTSTLPVWRSPS